MSTIESDAAFVERLAADWYDHDTDLGAFERLIAIARRGAMQSFQNRVDSWLIACFGETIARDKAERNHRFIEEALELVQANGCTKSEAHQLVDYVFGRPIGKPPQEVGGVKVTLAALCLASGLDMDECGEIELERVWTREEEIRWKQAAKPKHSPLPAAPIHTEKGETNGDGFAALRSANIRRNAEWAKGAPLSLAFRGVELAGEVGEACNVMKKIERERLGLVGSRDTFEHLAEELADIVICADLIAMDINTDLFDAIAKKFNATSVAQRLSTKLTLARRAQPAADQDAGVVAANQSAALLSALIAKEATKP